MAKATPLSRAQGKPARRPRLRLHAGWTLRAWNIFASNGYTTPITPVFRRKRSGKFMLDRTSLVITILGAINWLLVGLFQFDLVAYLCGGQAAVVSRVIYTIVGIAGLWCISLLFRERHAVHEGE